MAKKVPTTKNGPKGTSDFKVFLPVKISPIPIIAPIKKAEKRANKIFGKPKKRPRKKASFISPIPIHLPQDIKTIIRKKAEAKKAESKELISNFEL